MNLDAFVALAARRGASDLHLEPGMPPALRVRGELEAAGDPVPAETLREICRTVLGPARWKRFASRRSADFSKTVHGVRCRINVLQTMRGTGCAVRLLSWVQPTLERLNLHPDLGRLVRAQHGLVLVCGPTGSGKSSTLAALLHEVNARETCHILTLEQPIEFLFRPRKALIRQREVGVDTPSFRRGLLDAMREDPDVLMVGEMRDPTTMRLTLNAAETGHLVLSTVHSATVVEALDRIATAFPPEVRPMVCAQLADCLRAVVCQRLRYREDAGIRVPECEILIATTPVKVMVRQGQFFKLETALETGAKDGQFTGSRYRAWLDRRETFHVADPTHDAARFDEPEAPAAAATGARPEAPDMLPQPQPAGPEPAGRTAGDDGEGDVIVIQPPTESFSDLLDELDGA